tara:strand:+ start:15836 stop:16531 length:696 start_codon:yes stop_codon:yes gene_type:complete
MIHCAILDDEPTARQILEIHISEIESLKLVGKCRNAIELLNLIAKERVDLLFLDINMPDVSGITLAKTLSKDVKVIFTTAHREYAVEGFDLQAVDYLLKPVSVERLKQAVDKYFKESGLLIKESPQSETNGYLDVISNRANVRINFEDIIYVESMNDLLIVHTINGPINTRMSISEVESLLDPKLFLRTHRSFIVTKKLITSFTKEYVMVKGVEVPISRSYKVQVANALSL